MSATARNRTRSSSDARRSGRTGGPVVIEGLEGRQMMSGTPLAQPIPVPVRGLPTGPVRIVAPVAPTGVLTVNGTSGNDQIRITRTPTQIVVNVNGAGTFASIARVTRIVVNGLGGHDRILLVDPAGKPCTADGGGGNDFISGSPGNDHLYGGAGRDWIQANNGRDFVRGGAGNDTLEGGAGHDILAGGTGSDRMFGQTGDDFFYANDNEFDFVDGGLGTDRAQLDLFPSVGDGRNSLESFFE